MFSVNYCLHAAVTAVKLWALSRQDYQQILTFSGLRIHHQRVRFLQRSLIHVLQKTPDHVLRNKLTNINNFNFFIVVKSEIRTLRPTEYSRRQTCDMFVHISVRIRGHPRDGSRIFD